MSFRDGHSAIWMYDRSGCGAGKILNSFGSIKYPGSHPGSEQNVVTVGRYRAFEKRLKIGRQPYISRI